MVHDMGQTCRSPTDNLLVAMGRWMDETIPLVPNRYRTALQTSAGGRPSQQLSPGYILSILDATPPSVHA